MKQLIQVIIINLIRTRRSNKVGDDKDNNNENNGKVKW